MDARVRFYWMLQDVPLYVDIYDIGIPRIII